MSNSYWKKREEKQKLFNIKEEKAYNREIQKIYDQMLSNINNEINNFYIKYATEEGISMKEAIKRCDKLDIEKYQEKAKKYVARKDLGKIANSEMRIYNLTMKVNRLEMLKANIGLAMIDGHNDLEKYVEKILGKRTVDELKRQAGILGSTIKDNKKLAKSIVNASFNNATFSDRIWANQDLLKYEMEKVLSRGLIAGENPRKMATRLKKAVSTSTSNAQRLMRTELARVQIDAAEKGFKSAGVEEYEYIALGDACDICASLDGRHFKVDKMCIGENAPPMHPNCRCSIAPYINEKEYNDWLDFLEQGGTTKEWNERK